MVTLCMIIKDEQETLKQCLDSVKELVSEIVIVDTGSKDKSKEIAYKYTDKVFDFKWNNNFSEARNFSLKKASNKWVLILDADEIVINFNKKDIVSFCNNTKAVVGRIERVNYFEDEFGEKKYIERVNRLFNTDYFLYEGIIHEQVISKNKYEYKTENIEISVNHIGYSKEVLSKVDKVGRNIELLNKAIEKEENDPYLYYQLGKSYFMGKDYSESYKNFKKALEFVERFDYEYVEDLIDSYGYSMLNLQLYKEALELYEYEKYFYKSPDFRFLLGLIEMNNGNFERAVQAFLNCTKFVLGKIDGVTSFLPLYNIGVIFECLGFKDEALSYYKMCGNYEPALLRIQNC